MKNTKKLPYYLFAIIIFIMLKITYYCSTTQDLVFILKPIDKIIELLTGTKSVYNPANGYYHENLDILIDKSCSGFNFWILSFLIFTYLTLKHVDTRLIKIIYFPISLIGTYLLTIFVNSSRIFTSIVIQNQTRNMVEQQHFIHESIGIITNVSFLVLCYVLTEKYLSKKRANAKFA